MQHVKDTMPTSIRLMMSRTALAFAAILAVAAWLRVADLGTLSFDFDEYLHVLPAARVAEGQPACP
jgi:hypothetical protein